MMKINNWLTESTQLLSSQGITTARLDSIVLLEHILGIDRVKILTSDDTIPSQLLITLNTYRDRRASREPLAYIVGTKEFYGRTFTVNKNVLIPRPESETIVDIVRELSKSIKYPQIADIGTGSGNLAVTIDIEIPRATVIGYDIDVSALEVAKQNNDALGAHVTFIQSDLLENRAPNVAFDIVVANLPYVSTSQNVSVETNHEPHHALYAENDGLQSIFDLLEQVESGRVLKPRGFVVLESEPRQHSTIEHFAARLHFRLLRTTEYIQLFQYQN